MYCQLITNLNNSIIKKGPTLVFPRESHVHNADKQFVSLSCRDGSLRMMQMDSGRLASSHVCDKMKSTFCAWGDYSVDELELGNTTKAEMCIHWDDGHLKDRIEEGIRCFCDWPQCTGDVRLKGVWGMARAEVVQFLALDSAPVQLGRWSGIFEGYCGDLPELTEDINGKEPTEAIALDWMGDQEKQLMANSHGPWKVVSTDWK